MALILLGIRFESLTVIPDLVGVAFGIVLLSLTVFQIFNICMKTLF